MIKEYRSARGLDGPLMIVEEVDDVTYGELADIEMPDGSVRRGQVLEAAAGRALVQLFESPQGIATSLSTVRFTGPADDGAGVARHARPYPERHRRAARRRRCGDPGATARHQRVADQPVRADFPEEFIQTGISAIDGNLTLVRGQKLPIFSGSGLPHSELAGADRAPGTYAAWRGAVRGGVRGDGHYLRGSQLLHGGLPPHRRHRTGGAVHQPGRRSGDRTHLDSARGADHGGVPGVRPATCTCW